MLVLSTSGQYGVPLRLACIRWLSSLSCLLIALTSVWCAHAAGCLSFDRDSIDMACLGVTSLAWEVLANFPAVECVFAVAVIASPKDGRHDY